MNENIIGLIALGIASCIFIFWGAALIKGFIDYFRIMKNGVGVRAKVTGIKKKTYVTRSGNSSNYTAMITYRAGGRKIKANSMVNCTANSYFKKIKKNGIPIHYDTQNPEHYVLDGTGLAVLFCLAVLYVLIPVPIMYCFFIMLTEFFNM